jgi:hypothetical protein
VLKVFQEWGRGGKKKENSEGGEFKYDICDAL